MSVTPTIKLCQMYTLSHIVPAANVAAYKTFSEQHANNY